jgi:hypothetical protein
VYVTQARWFIRRAAEQSFPMKSVLLEFDPFPGIFRPKPITGAAASGVLGLYVRLRQPAQQNPFWSTAMLGKLFGKQTATQSTLVVVQLNDRAQPMDRGELYEDPLMEVLKHHRAGEVVGGGTMLREHGEIDFCEIEIEVREPVAENVAIIQEALEAFGAPKGSKLRLEAQGQELPIGKYEGLAVYLNGTDLPDDVYAECDAGFVHGEFDRLLGDDGQVHSHWQGPTETALYMYGPSFETMKNRLADFLDTYPLCQRARIVQIA